MPKNDDPQLLKYLNEAVKLEKSSMKFYTTARNKTSNFNMKTLLNAFLTVEIEHLLTVSKVRDLVKKKQTTKAVAQAKKFKSTVPVNPFKDMVQLEKFSMYGSDIFTLFKGATELEQKAENFYRDDAGSVKHPEIKKFFTRFAADEKRHQKFLLKHKVAVYNDGYWLGIDHVRLQS